MICIVTRTHHITDNKTFNVRKVTETTFVGFGEKEELDELVENDKNRWIKMYKEFTKSEWEDYDSSGVYKGELCRRVSIHFKGDDSRHDIRLDYLFIKDNTRMLNIN